MKWFWCYTLISQTYAYKWSKLETIRFEFSSDFVINTIFWKSKPTRAWPNLGPPSLISSFHASKRKDLKETCRFTWVFFLSWPARRNSTFTLCLWMTAFALSDLTWCYILIEQLKHFTVSFKVSAWFSNLFFAMNQRPIHRSAINDDLNL